MTMITRIFRVRINPDLREEFELKFADISVHAVQSQDGFLSVQIGKPTKWTPDEYVMITQWVDEDSLKKFVGESWEQAHIPQGMDKFIRQCWLHHFEDYGNS